ncbi:MAG TPA: zf-HC2 domain-containing protein [Longimicrobium sp.]|nr:zf-HC2 domain-containing protein [Longimicrobium sp.]
MMMDCDTFLDGHSDFRDGLLMLPERVAFEAHLRECDHCARYDRVVDKGVRVLRDQPELEVSDDFMDRLQHRLYHVDDEMAAARRRRSPVSRGAAAALGAAASVAAVALLPRLYAGAAAPTVTLLQPVAASAPAAAAPAYRTVSAPGSSQGLAAQLEEVGVDVYPMPYADVLYRTASYAGAGSHGSVLAE